VGEQPLAGRLRHGEPVTQSTQPQPVPQPQQATLNVAANLQDDGQVRWTVAVGPATFSLVVPVAVVPQLRQLVTRVLLEIEQKVGPANTGLVVPGDPRMIVPPHLNGGGRPR
jgi:hypothetical protein